MTKQLFVRAAATTALALSLTAGLASADVGNTGPSSQNKVTSNFSNSQTVHNNNNLGLDNHNSQTSNTGSAKADHNTTAGDATSGDASNANELTVNATVDNTSADSGMGGSVSDPSADMGGIDTTGPNSNNEISAVVTNKVEVDNNNDVSLQNNNWQGASSGNAEVNDNTTGGSATSGGASNTNSADFTLQISN